MECRTPRVVIAGTNSGAGKSTITMGLLLALKERGMNPQSFKAGPDYLDPMHHTMVLGKECVNLDTWMFPREVKRIFAEASEGSGISVTEGVMGLYDGISGVSEEGSTAHLSKMIKSPVILVIDAKAMARSAGAIAMGFKKYDTKTNLAGVIFNRVGSQNHLNILENSLKGIRCLGGVLRDDCMKLESRHLGLIPAMENYDHEKYQKIMEHVRSCVDIDMLIEIANEAPPLSVNVKTEPKKGNSVRIGVAKDKAFNFYYAYNIESLKRAGAEIVYFSPMEDDLPDVDGLYIGGGYPEMFAADLERNVNMRRSIKKASEDGMPIYAECGGLMYMSEYIEDLEGQKYDMCGVTDTYSVMKDSRKTLGYVEVTAIADTPICRKGWTFRGHEFHYSSTFPLSKENYAFDVARGKGIEDGRDGIISDNTLAGYTHIHFASNTKIPERFVGSCKKYSRT